MKSASLEINNLTAYLEVNEPEIHVPLAVQIDYAGVCRLQHFDTVTS